MWKPGAIALVLAMSCAAVASAQTTGAPAPTQTQGTQQPPPAQQPAETRPATTTFMGDTGLWFVPTGEVVDGEVVLSLDLRSGP